MNRILGLALGDALAVLAKTGVEPQVIHSHAPRREGMEGTLRVVRVREGGRALVVCAFTDTLGEGGESSVNAAYKP